MIGRSLCPKYEATNDCRIRGMLKLTGFNPRSKLLKNDNCFLDRSEGCFFASLKEVHARNSNSESANIAVKCGDVVRHREVP
jgi:hypothetical protein